MLHVTDDDVIKESFLVQFCKCLQVKTKHIQMNASELIHLVWISDLKKMPESRDAVSSTEQ